MLGYVWTCLYLYHLSNLLRYITWLILCYWDNPIQYIRLCSFWARPPFVPKDMHNFASCVVSFRPACWMLTILQLINFFLFTFLLQCGISLRDHLLQQCPFPLGFHVPDVGITTDGNPIIGLFILRVLGFLYPVVSPGLVLCAGCIMPCKNSRWLAHAT